MLKFNDYKYIRPDFSKLEKEMMVLIDRFKNSESFQEQDEIFMDINNLRRDVITMMNLVYIRHSINTLDEYYKEEQEFFDENMPKFEDLDTKFYRVLLVSPFRKELEEKWGEQLFRLADSKIKSFSDEIIDEAVEENKLVGEYIRLVAKAEIEFDGEIRNLSGMTPFMQSKDREVRKEANKKMADFFNENQASFDDIYDRLVKVRDKMAKKLGYENFVELGYYRMNRTDYDKNDVKNYRDQVYRDLVPVMRELKERQRKRLGLDDLKYYDESLQFLSGNPNPKGDLDWIVDNGKKMYSELSKETKEFFDFMIERDLMDLEGKKGKMSGGYCTSIDNYKSPFIFANFNGTRGDVDVLTHEAGHAFQGFRSRDFEIPEYGTPTYEAAEIHSMSMEFITWPWMDLFFEEDVDKYKFVHLAGAVSFIPYGVLVDEFQHYVYENPEVTPEARRLKWRELENKYLPDKDYDGEEFFENGGFWFRQGHIFEVPFYYIDYTLAQVCAFQFFNKFNESRTSSWDDYLRLCDQGGSKSFLELLDVAGLENPFIDGTIKKTIEPIKKWLDAVDDSKF